MEMFAFPVLCSLIVYTCQIVSVYGFNLTILHTNDFQSRFVEFNVFGSEYGLEPDIVDDGVRVGGVARLRTKIEEIRASHSNVLLLDAGDQFTGSLWFDAYEGEASAIFMNMLGYDAMCIGDKEFALGDDILAAFIAGVSFPLVSANINPTKKSPLIGTFSKSINLTVGGEQIGIVGYTAEETLDISKPRVTNARFSDPVQSVQEEVTKLRTAGIEKIIALGHSGYETDLKVAEIDGVDIVVGGHTKTFLYDGTAPSIEQPEGPYPTVVAQAGGAQALVVQAGSIGKYLGYLVVDFDGDGNVTSFSGNPILLDNSVPQDAYTLELVSNSSVQVAELNNTKVSSSNVDLYAGNITCRTRECNLANAFLDAVVAYHLDWSHPSTSWAPAVIAIWNSGALRADIPKGDVTYGDVDTVLPFNNEIHLLTVSGSVLREQLEHSVRDLGLQLTGKFAQVSGLRVVYDIKPVERRVITVDVLCLDCADGPRYLPLDDQDEYRLFTNDFMADGGDGYDFQPIDRIRLNSLATTVFARQLRKCGPVFLPISEGRIVFQNRTQRESPSSTAATVSSPQYVLLFAVSMLMMLHFRD